MLSGEPKTVSPRILSRRPGARQGESHPLALARRLLMPTVKNGGPTWTTNASTLPQSFSGEVQAEAGQAQAPTSWAPTAKVGTGALAGAFTILLCAFLTHGKFLTQQELTPAIVAAFTTIFTFGIQYWVPDAKK